MSEDGTSPVTGPPSANTSFTNLELTYVYCSAGIMNTVSISGPSRRFINAIWSSYSKSDTARRPRTIAVACFRWA